MTIQRTYKANDPYGRKAWTPQDVKQLISLFKQDYSHEQIAEITGRTRNAIVNKCQHLELYRWRLNKGESTSETESVQEVNTNPVKINTDSYKITLAGLQMSDIVPFILEIQKNHPEWKYELSTD